MVLTAGGAGDGGTPLASTPNSSTVEKGTSAATLHVGFYEP